MEKQIITEEQVLEELKKVVDPELGFNIVDMGLIYGIVVKDDKVELKMTLTSPGCPLGGAISLEAEKQLKANLNVQKVDIDLVFDPPWTPEKMTPQLRAQLGL